MAKPRSSSAPGGTTAGRLAAAAAVGIALPLLTSCQPPPQPPPPSGPVRLAFTGTACPRPQLLTGAPEFNAQEQEIRGLRHQAFRGDFFAQIDLGHRYAGRDSREHNLEDPVESAVWYELALANPDGYSPTFAYEGPPRYQRADCRTSERIGAADALERLLERMSSEERQSVRDRVTYVLSTEGAQGFRTLARLHDAAFGPFGDPLEETPPFDTQRSATPATTTLFAHNDIDVYLYNYLAAQAGDVAGFVLMKDLERSSQDRAGLAGDAEARARRWTPPFEFYPPGAPQSGVPHSDESDPPGEAEADALGRRLPFTHIADALTYLHVINRPYRFEHELTGDEVKAFQAMVGRPVTGVLTPVERLRAIQYAAVNGSPKAQLALAVMYSEGIGTARDDARAFHWFQEADKQGSPEAKYAMSTYFSLGVAGVADQDKAKAVIYQIDAALAGFRPSVERLRDILAHIAPRGAGPIRDPVREPVYEGRPSYVEGPPATYADPAVGAGYGAALAPPNLGPRGYR